MAERLEADGTVYIQHGGKVHVQMRQGKPVTVGIEAGRAGTERIRNPWPGENVEIVKAHQSAIVLPPVQQTFLNFKHRQQPHTWCGGLQTGKTLCPFVTVSGTQATIPKPLGSNTIGIRK